MKSVATRTNCHVQYGKHPMDKFILHRNHTEDGRAVAPNMRNQVRLPSGRLKSTFKNLDSARAYAYVTYVTNQAKWPSTLEIPKARATRTITKKATVAAPAPAVTRSYQPQPAVAKAKLFNKGRDAIIDGILYHRANCS